MVPAGTHTVKWSKGGASGPGLLRFTGELGTASVARSSMTLRYDSRAVAYAVVDRRPVGTDSLPNPDGGFAVRLPPGRHTVTIGFAAGAHSGSGHGALVAVVVGLLALVAVAWGVVRLRSPRA